MSFFAFAEPCDATRLVELDAVRHDSRAATPAWLRVVVQFSGDCYGHLVLDVPPRRRRASCVASFVGAMPDDRSPRRRSRDGVGEFANMVCGAWLTDAATRLTSR